MASRRSRRPPRHLPVAASVALMRGLSVASSWAYFLAGDRHGRRNSPHRLIPVDYCCSHAQCKNTGSINSELDADTRTELGQHEMTQRREQDAEAKYFQRLLAAKDHRLSCRRAEKTSVWRHEGSNQNYRREARHEPYGRQIARI